ncbi:MAG: ABC transporter permease subunit [Pirellulales bacterium]|nr:ABC transporter permease subunit [Pirellulales bacterium]
MEQTPTSATLSALLMLLGPIFRVELVTVARRRRYFFLRLLYGLVILFVLWACYENMGSGFWHGQQQSSIQQAAKLAAAFFLSFSWLQMLAILAVGPAMAVGTLATERERRTIEYLFTTDLANHEIVLGKLCARLALLGQLVLVGLPVLFIFRLLGGIPANLLVATFLLAASTAVLLASFSVCISVWSPRARDATVRVYLVLAALLFLPMLFHSSSGLGLFASQFWQNYGVSVVDACLTINPMWTLGNAIANSQALGAGLDMSTVYRSVGYQFLVSVAATLLATAAVRRVHLRDSSSGSPKNSRTWSFRLPRWRPRLGNHPMLWKEMFAGTAVTKLGFVGFVAMALILLTVAGFTIYFFLDSAFNASSWKRDNFFEYLVGLTGCLGTGMLLLLAARASGLFTQEKERDCWMSLLATPLTAEEIVRGKMFGNLYSMRWSFFVLLSCWGLGLLLEPDYIVTILVLSAVFLLIAWYVTNVGLLFSLRSKTTLRAMGSALGTLIFTGGGYLFCCCVVMASSRSGDAEIMLAACIPFLIALPALAYAESHVWQNEILFAFGLGVVGYFILAVLLYWLLTRQFDQFAGRSNTGPEGL